MPIVAGIHAGREAKGLGDKRGRPAMFYRSLPDLQVQAGAVADVTGKVTGDGAAPLAGTPYGSHTMTDMRNGKLSEKDENLAKLAADMSELEMDQKSADTFEATLPPEIQKFVKVLEGYASKYGIDVYRAMREGGGKIHADVNSLLHLPPDCSPTIHR